VAKSLSMNKWLCVIQQKSVISPRTITKKVGFISENYIE
jgi:hypothetical protein